jgi:hypothetical protein
MAGFLEGHGAPARPVNTKESYIRCALSGDRVRDHLGMHVAAGRKSSPGFYRPAPANPYHEYLRKRRTKDPAVPALR